MELAAWIGDHWVLVMFLLIAASVLDSIGQQLSGWLLAVLVVLLIGPPMAWGVRFWRQRSGKTKTTERD